MNYLPIFCFNVTHQGLNSQITLTTGFKNKNCSAKVRWSKSIRNIHEECSMTTLNQQCRNMKENVESYCQLLMRVLEFTVSFYMVFPSVIWQFNSQQTLPDDYNNGELGILWKIILQLFKAKLSISTNAHFLFQTCHATVMHNISMCILGCWK